jgi:hypothetical protein
MSLLEPNTDKNPVQAQNSRSFSSIQMDLVINAYDQQFCLFLLESFKKLDKRRGIAYTNGNN